MGGAEEKQRSELLTDFGDMTVHIVHDIGEVSHHQRAPEAINNGDNLALSADAREDGKVDGNIYMLLSLIAAMLLRMEIRTLKCIWN
jgi:hypothetical protein